MKLFTVVLVCVCAISGVLGEEIFPASEMLTLEQCISRALDNHPLVQSAHQLHRASLARVHQARAIQQPSLDYDSDLQPGLFDFRGSAESYFGVSQSLEFPGKRSLRGKIASKEADAIFEELELLKLEVAFQVKQAFFELLLAKERQRYAEQNLSLARDFLEKAGLKHDAGGVARVEVLRARVEASRAADSLQAVQSELILAKARLNFLLARKRQDPLEIEGDLKWPVLEIASESLKDKALSFRPEIRRIRVSMERETLKKTLGRLSYLPDFNLGLARHRLAGVKTTWDFTLSIPIPLFFWQPARGEIAEAEANFQALDKEFEHLKNSVFLEVEEAAVNADTAGRRIQLIEKDILSQAEEVYNMMLFSYGEGEIGGIELIEARRTLVETRKAYADALYNYRVALAVLEKSVGQPVEGERYEK